MKREPLQVAWDIALGDLRRRHPELADLKSHKRAFLNAAAQVVARAEVRGLAAFPSSSRSDETRVLAVRTAKAALAFHPQWRDEFAWRLRACWQHCCAQAAARRRPDRCRAAAPSGGVAAAVRPVRRAVHRSR